MTRILRDCYRYKAGLERNRKADVVYHRYADGSDNQMDLDIFQDCSYQIWALEEIIRRIDKYSDVCLQIDEIESFAVEMDNYACASLNSWCFLTAYDTAIFILDCICGNLPWAV